MSEGIYRTRDGHWCRVEKMGTNGYRLHFTDGYFETDDTGSVIVKWVCADS